MSDAADPGRWSAAAVAAVLAAPEADPEDNFAAARAALAGRNDVQTTLTIT